MERRKRKKRRALTKSEQMSRVKGKDTGPERALRRALWHAGMRYRLHLRLPGVPDLAFPGCKTAVFVDGCFWHSCPQHYTPPATNAAFWSEKIERNRRRDREVDELLENLGWKVLRFWEHELEQGLTDVVARVRAEILRRRGLS